MTTSRAPLSTSQPTVPPALRRLRLGFRLLSAVSTQLAFRAAWRVFTTPRRLPPKKWEAAVLTEARPLAVPFGAGTLAAYEWGPAAGPVVLLVHGWEHRASFWGAFAKALAAAGYRAVAFDGPAHGASPGRRTTLPEFGAAIQAVADAVGPVWGVVAHSFGAAATAGLPVHFNGGQLLPRLVLLSVPGSTPAEFQRFAELLQLSAKVTDRMLRFVEAKGGRRVESFSLTRPDHPVPAVRALLFHDHADETIPFAEAQAIAHHWPGLDFRPTTGLGHNRILRDPAVIAQAVAFLEA
ncbi:Pimeloyl-ACP methyl ester carboxylesterase [Hymenobacter daecheongensis DSM 21074]|uniref:Pimeloyl-ACP methyl ester carboxylesterase n=1 Tax=Hymenobacter daecheongensis DSM 21074 TaxID=1121955 RepID=A0A1M6EVN8_9BACT|nr:alpha/beta hydrolase [Hymenobacter daecheongensis]SHI89476.1 Pimeloyl-ACP methyl ester carboxylesterase [Hymenobacter daecheongensis DSM 21074]